MLDKKNNEAYWTRLQVLGGRAGWLLEMEGTVDGKGEGNMSLRLITPKKLDMPRDGYEENEKIIQGIFNQIC